MQQSKGCYYCESHSHYHRWGTAIGRIDINAIHKNMTVNVINIKINFEKTYCALDFYNTSMEFQQSTSDAALAIVTIWKNRFSQILRQFLENETEKF